MAFDNQLVAQRRDKKMRRQAGISVFVEDGTLLGSVDVADSLVARLVGLLAHQRLAPGRGLLLSPAWAIHTWFMRFPIDVIFLDVHFRVVRVCPALASWRLASGSMRARHVLELGPGTLARTSVAPGARLRLEVNSTEEAAGRP